MVNSFCLESVAVCFQRLAAFVEAPPRRSHLQAAQVRLAVLRVLQEERFASVAELTRQDEIATQTKPADIARLLLVPDGLPVICLNAPEGTSAQNMAALTFYGLAEEPHIVATLIREQQRVSAELQPARVLNHVELRRQLRQLRDGKDVPMAAVLTAAFGSEEAAARHLHAKLSDVNTAVAGAAAAAEKQERRYATLLLVECMKEGITDPANARRVVQDRARRTLGAEQANAAASPDVFDVQGTPDDSVFAQAVRDGINFIITSEMVRFSEFQTVKVGSRDAAEFRPRINLLEPISTIYSAYAKAFGSAALSESTFRRRCILPEMKPEGSRTCLCCHCEALLDAINLLIKLLRSPVLRSFLEESASAPHAVAARVASAAAAAPDAAGAAPPPTAPRTVEEMLQQPQPEGELDADDGPALQSPRIALLKRALALRRSFFEYGQEVRARVLADKLSDFCDSGKLGWDDLPEVAGLAGLVDSAAALVSLRGGEEDPAIADWLKTLLPLGGELDKLTEHLARRAWQNVRYEQHLRLLETYSGAGGKASIMLIFDFKEKVPAETKLREVQGDYWKNSVVSVLGVTVYWYEDGALRQHYIDLVSADTAQDAAWMDAALPVIARELLKLFPCGISVVSAWSDNGCHFHNSPIFAESLPAFAKLLGCTLSWNFFEAGEGKGPCDQHFAVMSHVFAVIVRSRGALRGVEEIQAAINTMANTTALVLTVPRASEPSRGWSYTGITSFKQFILQAVPDGAGVEARLAALWHVRSLSGLGSAQPLAAGSWSKRWVRLSDVKTRELLTRALRRRAGRDRQEALVALLGSEPLLADSKCFGPPVVRDNKLVEPQEYLNALYALKFILEKEYTAAERDAAAVGGQQKPHTIAQAIVQLEHCRDVAHAGSEAAAASAGAPRVAAARVSPALQLNAAPPRPAPPPAPASAAAAAAAALQARIAAAVQEEHIAAARAAAARKELVALHRELQLNAVQAASGAALPLHRRAHSAQPAVLQRPQEDLGQYL